MSQAKNVQECDSSVTRPRNEKKRDDTNETQGF